MALVSESSEIANVGLQVVYTPVALKSVCSISMGGVIISMFVLADTSITACKMTTMHKQYLACSKPASRAYDPR
jgi:hypothetical protein